MNLLVVCPNLPRLTSGGGTRNFYLLKTLARKHTVSLLVLQDNETGRSYSDTSHLERFTHSIQLVTRHPTLPKRVEQLMNVVCGKSYTLNTYIVAELQTVLDDLLEHKHYDVVIFESVIIADYHLPEDVKVIIDQHNIEYEILQRTYQREAVGLRKWYSWLESRQLKRGEIERCRKADVLLVTSEREHLILKNMLSQSVIEVVPNGVDIEMFHGITREQEVFGRIVFTGAMDYYPNIDAVLFFARECWPLIRAQVPQATWQIVGGNPSMEVLRLAKLPGVTVTGSVLDVRPFVAASSVVIAPVLVGSGTRLKVLEALAMQKALISTSLGCEGLAVIPGKHLLVADQAEDFARAVITLMKNPELRLTLGSAGRSLVEAEYSWERCGARLLHILELMN